MKKTIIILLFVSVSAVLTSCLKGTVSNPAKPALLGNWALVNDSTTIQFWGLWQGRPDTGINYAGVAGDHYNFIQNGQMFIKEGANSDTGTYTNIAQNKLELKFMYLNGRGNPPDGWVEDFTINTLTEHALTLTGGTFVSPETASTHILYFQK
jgi:hypothetical protein